MSDGSRANDDADAPPPKRAKGEPQEQVPNPFGKRKVVLLVAYNGAKYHGLQIQPDVVTVEDVLEKALHASGGISEDNFGSLQKISWSRSGRTDKGVHALGQIISCKLILNPEGLLERTNERLAGTDISLLAIERVSNNFCAHTNCSSREYEYVMPASVLRTSSSAVGDVNAPLSDDESVRLLALFKAYEGTHSFHNFADGKVSHTDKSATRYMLSLTLGPPISLGGVSYVSFRLHGQSFMLHQIRKMLSMLTAVFRGRAPPDAISKALTLPKVTSVPLAPSCSLTLRRSLYSNYERRRTPDKASVHFPDCEAKQQAFLEQHILPHVARCAADGVFARFVQAVDQYDMMGFEATAARAAASAGGNANGDESGSAAQPGNTAAV